MADIIDFTNKTKTAGPANDNTGVDKVKPEPSVFEVTYLDGSSETGEGFLSVGPVFVAIVDTNDFIELVVSTEAIRSIRKLCSVKEWVDFDDAGDEAQPDLFEE